jgi:hypothetical protein
MRPGSTRTRALRAALAGIFAGLFLAGTAGCPPQMPPAGTAGPGTVAVVAPSAAPTTSASASAEDAGAPDAAQEPEPRERPPRAGTPGSTRGTVACGKVRCNAPAETCVWDEPSFAWTCKKVDHSKDQPGDEIGFACDDGTDCPDGQTCCRLFELGSFDHASCVKRGEVVGRCSAEICLQGGAKCPSGMTCTSPSTAEEGACDAPNGPATCAGKKRCPADKPICVMGAKGLACAAQGSSEFNAAPSDKRWECMRQEDCHGGEACSYVFGEIDHDIETFCSMYSMAYMGSMLCDPTGPSPCGKDADCLKMMACTHEEGAPAWMGVFHSK